MKVEIDPRAREQQRMAFYFALVNFLWLLGNVGARVYFAVLEDPVGDRHFVFATIGWLPVWVLCWIVAVVTVGNSILESRGINWYGVWTVGMLAVPAIPTAIFVICSYWWFLPRL